MSRKRPRLGAEQLGLRRRRGGEPAEADRPGDAAGALVLAGGASPGSPSRPGSARAAVAELGRLFPRGLFEDALPPIALRSQVYSLVPDRTVADRQLVRARGLLRQPLICTPGGRGPGAAGGGGPARESTGRGERARSPKGEAKLWELSGMTFVESGSQILLLFIGCFSRFLLAFPRPGSPVAYQC